MLLNEAPCEWYCDLGPVLPDGRFVSKVALDAHAHRMVRSLRRHGGHAYCYAYLKATIRQWCRCEEGRLAVEYCEALLAMVDALDDGRAD